MNHFDVGLVPYDMVCKINDDEVLPAHDLVIRPLLDYAIDCFVYGIKKDSPFFQKYSDILVRERSKYKIDLSKEVIKGREGFWNTGCWRRGSIVIVLDKGEEVFDKILMHCFRPGETSNFYTGNSVSAVKYCERLAGEGKIAICFPASNGIEWMQIHASREIIGRIYGKATVLCKELDLWDTQNQLAEEIQKSLTKKE